MALSPVRKAVIPAAGLGTRFLPFTKAIPKEMIPLIDKPVIQYAVEEAVSSGLRSVVIVTNNRKASVLDYFRSDPALEERLLAQGKIVEAAVVRDLGSLCEVEAVYQERAAGLGDAIRCAREAVDNEPFAVLLPDVVMLSQQPCMQQLITCREHHPGSIIATREVEPNALNRFGILAGQPAGPLAAEERVFRVTGLVEKPDVHTAPSRFGVFGRYVLEPEIFDYFETMPPGGSGEIELTHVLSRYAADHPLYGFAFEGDHFDIGDKIGFLQATFELALRNPSLRQRLLPYLQSRCTELRNVAAS